MATTKKRTTTGKTTKKKTKTQTRTAKSRTQSSVQSFIPKEILILLVFALCVLLFLSNLDLCGSFGKLLKGFCIGGFGLMGYLFPPGLFCGFLVCFLHKYNTLLHIKTGVGAVCFLLLSGLAELIGLEGGVTGGFLVDLLKPALGALGAGIILFVLLIIGLVFITEKSVLKPLRSGSSKLYHSAQEEAGRRKEIHAEKSAQRKAEREAARMEEENRRRVEKKVSGVAFDTEIKVEKEPEPEEIPIMHPVEEPEIQVHINKAEPEPEEIIPPIDDRAITVKKDQRTLGELEAIDNLHASFSRTQYAERSTPEAVETTGLESDFVPEPLPSAEITDFAPEELPKDSAFRMKRQSEMADTKTVMTASGKKIEVEVKPEDLVKKVDAGNIWASAETSRNRTGSGSVSMKMEPAKPRPKVKKEYVFPPTRLLGRGQNAGSSQGNDRVLRETAVKLQQTLHNFGVEVTVTNISCGPSVTRYELQPEQGVKVSKILSLSDDIKLNLAAADIRIEAPIPGKAAVGIEVPNAENMTVYLRELLESEAFKKHPSRLSFAVGKDIAGQIVVTDLAKMPHLLIAGATGSGKSVCINTLIMSIIYKAKPEEVKLIMVDPKVVELSVYNGIPHLMIPVVTDPKKASAALNWAVAEMTDRYQKFADHNVRDLKAYNAKVQEEANEEDEYAPKPLPQIVIIIDELADLMMVAPGEVEEAICRLTQLARAAGIHLVIATQRPSVNVITGLIKANVPSRIAFAVSSGVDSRTIIDMNGAEKLLGKGDMLFAPYGSNKPTRLQGCFVSDAEVMRVVDFVSKQRDESDYNIEIENQISLAETAGVQGASKESELDEYFAQAGRFVIEKEKASSSMLQRMFKVGFNRAARIVDQLCEAGVVGEDEGTKPRKILMTMDEFDDYLRTMQIQ